MASYCLQCSVHVLGADYRDLAGIVSEEDAAKGLGVRVVCQGCGNAFVDHEGRCHSHTCTANHGDLAHGPSDASNKYME